jgi:hypothetical protein
VIRRFQIEDLIDQDSSGVIFRAHDTASGKTVALRRFFPFGVDGGGLHADEQTAYNIAVDRLAGLSHPALRSVICGGCDPVDSIPFIATEWVEGLSIQMLIQQGPLAPEAATRLISQALEVCELLSHVLAEEAVWVETELPSIITGSDSSSREFTFWISPLKWLGGQEKSRGLESMVTLTEQIMGWQGRTVMDHAGHGLGAWLKWLRGAAATTSLHEAREMLAASIGVEPPPSAKTLAAQATRQLVKRSKPPSFRIHWAMNVGLALLAVGLGAGFVIRHRAKQTSPQTPAPTAPTVSPNAPQRPVILSDAAQVSRRAAELSALARQEDQQHAIILAQQQATAQKMGGVIAWTSHELLVHNEGTQVVVEGVLEKIDFSGTRKTLYLMFSKEAEENDPRGAVILKTAAADLSAESLTPLLGKKIRLHGTLKMQTGFDLKRPEIQIKERASIEVIE